MYGQKSTLPSKAQVQVLLTKIKQYYNLQKQRKSNDVVKQQRQLVKLIKGEGRSKLQEALMMEKIVNILRYINALRLLASYTDAIKQNSACIAEPTKYRNQVHQLLPYVMGIIYSAKPTGLNCITQFKEIMEEIFGAKNLEMAYTQGQFIPKDVRKCFEPINPSFGEINQYAIEMCQRNQFSLEALNSVGHKFSIYGGQVKIAVGNQGQGQGQGQGYDYRQQAVQSQPQDYNKGRGNGNNNGNGNGSPYGYGGGGNTGNGHRNGYGNGNGGNQGGYTKGVSPAKTPIYNYNPYNDNNRAQQPQNNYHQSPPKLPQRQSPSPSREIPSYTNHNHYGGDYVPSFTPTPASNQPTPSNQIPSSYLPAYQPTNFSQFKIPPPPESRVDPSIFHYPNAELDLDSRLKKL